MASLANHRKKYFNSAFFSSDNLCRLIPPTAPSRAHSLLKQAPGSIDFS